MINMDYCKFENTFRAWEECKDNMETSSERELKYAKSLLKSVLDLMLDEQIIEDYNEEELKYFIESMGGN